MGLHALLVAVPAWLLLALAGGEPRTSPALGALLAGVSGWGVLEARWTSAHHPGDGGAAARLPALQGLLLWSLTVCAARTLLGGPAGPLAPVGAALVSAGIFLRLAAIRTLAGQFRTRLEGAPDQVLVTGGLYAWIRHPSELGHVCVALGLAVIAGAGPIGPIVALVAAAALLLAVYRVRREDLALARDHGPRFVAHAAAVGAWSPVRTLCARLAARRRRAH